MSSRRENPASTNFQTKNNSQRPIPRSTSKSRYIIRTRSQASRAPLREPLRDAPTNSPTQETRPTLVEEGMRGSGSPLPPKRKRASSPSFDVGQGAPQDSKKAKVHQSPSKSPAKSPSKTAGPSEPAGSLRQAGQEDENMYKTPFQPSRTSITPVPTVDLFDTPPSPTRPK